jgi:hypothetical protein
MEIRDAQGEKSDLEGKIYQWIKKFEKDTGLTVESIEVHRSDVVKGYGRVPLSAVTIKATL